MEQMRSSQRAETIFTTLRSLQRLPGAGQTILLAKKDSLFSEKAVTRLFCGLTTPLLWAETTLSSRPRWARSPVKRKELSLRAIPQLFSNNLNSKRGCFEAAVGKP